MIVPNDAPGADTVDARFIEDLDDYSLDVLWTHNMSEEQKAALAPDVRARCLARIKKLKPPFGTSSPLVERAKRAMAGLDTRPALRFPHVWIDDAQVGLENDYIIKGLISGKSLTVVFGPSGDGKTFFTGDLIGHVATGLPWRGRRIRPGLAVYVAAEAGTSILRRFYAWRDHRFGDEKTDRIPLAIITRGANLLNAVEVECLILELRSIAEEIGVPLSIVVFDTLSRSMPGGDENAAMDMSRVIEAADRIRDELDAATLIVHHTGKDTTKGPRGSNALFAAADTVISVVERVATLDKVRDGTAGEAFPFDLQVVELGEDQDGDKVTTCIVVPTNTAPPPAKAAKLAPDEQIALEAIREQLSATGEAMPGTSVIPQGVKAIRVDAWRNRFYARLGDVRELESAAKRQAWHRGRKGLISRHTVTCWEDFAWLTKA